MALTSNQKNLTVFLATLGLVAGAAALYLAAAGNTDDNIRLVLRSSARLAFLVLLVIFVARPLRQLLARPATATLLKNRRLFGIAFAGVHTAHLGLVFFRSYRVPDFELNFLGSLPGGLAYLLIYLMLITSFDRPAHAIGRRNWKILHKVGLYYVFLIFLPTLIPASRDQLLGTQGILILLTAVVIVIRLTAFLANRRAAAA